MTTCRTEESEPAAVLAAIARRTGSGSAPSALAAPAAAALPSSVRRERGDMSAGLSSGGATRTGWQRARARPPLGAEWDQTPTTVPARSYLSRQVTLPPDECKTKTRIDKFAFRVRIRRRLRSRRRARPEDVGGRRSRGARARVR